MARYRKASNDGCPAVFDGGASRATRRQFTEAFSAKFDVTRA
jgi:hypothetical protein